MSEESNFLGVTIRGWIAIFLVFTVCIMSFLKIKVEEPLYTLVMMAVSFYLGSKSASMTVRNVSSDLNKIEKQVNGGNNETK